MKIAVVHSYYASSAPSGENVAVDLQVAALRRRGHDVRVFSRATDDLASSRGYALKAARNVALGIGPSPLSEIRRFAPDVIHVHNLFPNFASRWLDSAPAPVVASLHNFRPLCAAGTLFRDGHDCLECPTSGSLRAVVHGCYRDSRTTTLPLAVATRDSGIHNAVLSRAFRLVCLAPRSARTYGELRPDLKGKIAVVPNFVEDSAGLSAPPTNAPWLYVGRLSPEKGIADLVSAWPTDEPLRIAGSGPLESEIQRLAQGKQITVIGQVGPQDVRRELQASVGLVFPSTWREGAAALSYVEATSEGRATLAVGENAVTDDVREFGTGVVAADMTEVARLASATRKDARRLGGKARARFEARFTEAAWLDAIETVYAAATGS